MPIKFAGKAKLTKQGQLTLPSDARKALKLLLESDVYWYAGNGFLIVTKELHNEKDAEGLIKGGKKK